MIRTARLLPAHLFAAELSRVQQIRRGTGNLDAGGSVMSISLADITSELAKRDRPPPDPAKTVPADVLKQFPKLFDKEEAMKLPPHRAGLDYEVNLVRDSSGNEVPLP